MPNILPIDMNPYKWLFLIDFSIPALIFLSDIVISPAMRKVRQGAGLTRGLKMVTIIRKLNFLGLIGWIGLQFMLFAAIVIYVTVHLVTKYW